MQASTQAHGVASAKTCARTQSCDETNVHPWKHTTKRACAGMARDLPLARRSLKRRTLDACSEGALSLASRGRKHRRAMRGCACCEDAVRT
eukprot:5559208-Pleurochrysis_carterae.AAC.2